MISSIAAAGIFFAVPVLGRAAVGRLTSLPAIARPSVWVCAGGALWSLPLLGSLIAGAYRPDAIGVAGWIVVAIYLGRRRRARPRLPRLSRPDKAVLAGVLLAAALAAAHPADPFATGRDMGVYANHAVYMVNHGRLDVPYSWAPGGTEQRGFLPFAGFYPTQPTMTVQFGHLYSAWLAQTYAVAHVEGLVRLNIVLGVLSLLCLFGFAKRFVSPTIAAFAIVFLAFNPAQLWTARTTLSEVATQLFIWSGLLLLTAFLARGSPRVGMWAGVLLGMSALIRIDGFLLVPFLLTAHAVWNLLRPRAGPVPARTWRHAYFGAMPFFGLAVAYYVLFSRPYLIQQESQVIQLAGLTVVSAGLLALSRLPVARRLGNMALSRRPIVLSTFGALAAVMAYAYFVRPLSPPFDILHVPGHPLVGERSHIEDALPNLGSYLTPPVVWAALVGWSVLALAAIRRWQSTALVPFLIVALGCSAVYAWNQSIAPDHFWAIRRFIPVVIPAVVLLAGAAATVALSGMSIPGRRIMFGLSVLPLVAYTAAIGWPTYAVEDRRGSYAFLAEFARTLPASGQILGLGGSYETANWWMPLYVAFDRPILPLDVTSQDGIAEAVTRLRGASEAEPLLVLTARGAEADAIQGLRTSEATLARALIDTPTTPLPSRTNVQEVTLTAIEAIGLDTMSVDFGGREKWLAPDSGFHPSETVDGRPMRWTNGHGRLLIPIEGGQSPRRLAITLADTGPDGGELRLVLNGTTLFAGLVPAGPWSTELDLAGVPGLQPTGTADLEIVSGVFRAEPVTDEDEELFGVQVQSATFLDPEN